MAYRWNSTFTASNHITITHPGRAYIANHDASSIQYNMFYRPNLLGGNIIYDVDLTKSKCSCNAALYLVAMPGYNSKGQPDPGKSLEYYCDASGLSGNKCPEIDIM